MERFSSINSSAGNHQEIAENGHGSFVPVDVAGKGSENVGGLHTGSVGLVGETE